MGFGRGLGFSKGGVILDRIITTHLTIPPIPVVTYTAVQASSPPGRTSVKNLDIPAPPTLHLAELALFDQWYDAGDDGDFSIEGLDWEAQTFTVNVGHNIEVVEIKCRRVGATPGDITIGIRATLADLPTGGDLTFITFDGNALPESDVWIERYVPVQALAGATKYAMVIRAPTGNAGNYLVWRKDGTVPTYAGGARCASDNGGGLWVEDTNTDFMFREGEVK